MKEALIIKETEDTPQIVFDISRNIFEISGRSLPEDAYKFYTPILEWIEEYVKEPNPETDFTFKLEYYNSASARKIIKILLALENIADSGKKIKATWYYTTEDDIMKARGEEIKSIIDIPMELKTY